MEQVLRAQFGELFRGYGALWRRRHELEYPAVQGDSTTVDEARGALATARGMVDAVRALLPVVGKY